MKPNGYKGGHSKVLSTPLEVKNAYAQDPGGLQGYGQVFVVSDDQKLEWADRFALFTQPPQARDMSYWPIQPHTFRLDFVFLRYLDIRREMTSFYSKHQIEQIY